VTGTTDRFCVCSLATEANGITGLDVLETLGASVDLDNQKLKLLEVPEPKKDPQKRDIGREQSVNCR
jgi:hypothetical protein